MREKQHIGVTLKKIREEKGIKVKDMVTPELTRSSLSRIEAGKQEPSAEKFLSVLSLLNITLEEFFLFHRDNEISLRGRLDWQISEVLRQRDRGEIKRLKREVVAYQKIYGSSYFQHMEIKLEAAEILFEQQFDFPKTRQILGKEKLDVIKTYLDSVEQWHYYEIVLLNDTLHLFDVNQALVWGDLAMEAVKRNYLHFKDQGLALSLLGNLAALALEDEQFYMKAHDFSSIAIGLPPSTRNMQYVLYAKMMHQIVCYKLKSDCFDYNYLCNLVNWFLLAEMEDAYKEYKMILKKHGIDLDAVPEGSSSR